MDLPRPIPWLLPGAEGSSTLPSGQLEVAASSAGAAPSASGGAQAATGTTRGRVRLPVLQSQSLPTQATVVGQRRPGAPTRRRSSWLARRLRRQPRPGSGLKARPTIVALVWLRRVSQAAFLSLFMWFLLDTAYRGSFLAESGQPVRLPWPVEAFLLADPFVALLTVLSTHQLYAGLGWSLGILLLTLLVGRAFCGWICPFGTVHQLLSWLFPGPALKGSRRVETNRTKPWQSLKYYLLVALLAMAAAGSAWGGLFDPLCVMVRGVGLGLLPLLQYLGMRSLQSPLFQQSQTTQRLSDNALDWLGSRVWTADQAYFHQAWLVVVIFLGIVALNRVVPRFWCRALCPLGALLGFFARFAIFGMEKDHAKCTDCNLCLTNCQGADSPEGGVKHRQDECHLCFNCETACPEDVIRFRFFPGRRSTQDRPDLQLRSALASATAGALLVPTARIANWPDKAYSPEVIRPPGSVAERDFLERCIRCAECMKVCPNNALHPAFFEAGPEGLWTPILIPRIGYCEHSCVLCGQVCPTGAIEKIEEKHKLGLGQKAISIGTAMFDRGRCLPWAMATPCTVCEEFCPTSPKAIWVEEVRVPRRGQAAEAGEPVIETVVVKRPHIDPELCIGCGACEKVCPVVDRPAVYVTSAGETRSRANVILLENTAYGAD